MIIYDAIQASGGYMSFIHPRTCLFAWNVYKSDFFLSLTFYKEGSERLRTRKRKEETSKVCEMDVLW